MTPVQRHPAVPSLLVLAIGLLALALAACANPASSASVAGATTTVQVRDDAKLGTVLTDAKGLTLYKYAKDGTNTSACNDTCAKAWPPLEASGTPTLPSGVSGTLATFARSDGSKQVSFNGVPLYRYSKDQKPGDVMGDGVGGAWSVANVANTRPAPAATAVPATRVSGTIQSVASGELTLSDGTKLTINSSTQVSRVVKAALSDLKSGDYVAITARRQPDNSLLASMVNVFPAAARGVASGQFPMGGGNLMTNAAIDQVSANGFTVTFPGGGAKITLAPDAKITRTEAADQSALTAGTAISAVIRDGVAQMISVQ